MPQPERARRERTGDRAQRRRPSAQRIRAARAYTGLERPEFAKRSGIATGRLSYLENGKGEPSSLELEKIRDASGVPMSFLQNGFRDESEPPQLTDRVGNLEGLVRVLAKRRLDDEGQAETDAALQAFESLLHNLEADDTPRTRPEQGATRGTGR